MVVIDIIKIICLVLLCLYSSFTDIKKGIVKNRVIVIVIGIGLFLNVIEWIAFDSTCQLKQITNILVVDIISIILYIFHIWAGGDCKLTFAIALLVPYNFYLSIQNEYCSLAYILAITFGVSYVFLVCDSVVYAVRKKKKIDKEKLFLKTKNIIGYWISCVAYITLIDFVLFKIFPTLPIGFVYLINICLTLIIGGISILRNKLIVVCVIIAGIILKLLFQQQIIDEFTIINYSVAVLFILLRMFIDEYNYETIPTTSVEKGMILSVATTIQFINSRVKNLPKQSTEDLRSRLTFEEAEAVRRWEKSKYGTPTVQIVRKLPFAIFISIGSILFMILGAII